MHSTVAFYPRVIFKTVADEILDDIVCRNARHNSAMTQKVPEITFSQKKGKDKAIIKSEAK